MKKLSGRTTSAAIRIALRALLPAVLSGCAPGFIYTDITTPLTVNMERTPRGTMTVTKERLQLKEPVTRGGIRAEWASYAIGDAARRGGLEEIGYADIRRQSLLGGIWEKTTVIVHGRGPVGAGTPATP